MTHRRTKFKNRKARFQSTDQMFKSEKVYIEDGWLKNLDPMKRMTSFGRLIKSCVKVIYSGF